jgi:hypothetical protein
MPGALLAPLVAASLPYGGVAGDADQLADAAATTLGEDVMSFELRFSIEGPGIEEDGQLAGRGDFAANRGTVVATTGGTESRSVFDGDVFWLASTDEAFNELLPEGKRWVRGSLAQLGPDAAVTELEPLSVLYVLNGAESVSVDDDAGSQRYAFDVDMTSAAESAPADRREDVRALIDAGADEATITGEAVVDGDEHVRELTVSATVMTTDGDVAITYDVTLDDFGEMVSVDQPPDDEVVDLDDVPELRDRL